MVDFLIALMALGFLAIVTARMPPMRPAEILHGAVRVTDGDTLELDGLRIRLQGIDAPELAQACNNDDVAYPCGLQARAALAQLVDGRPVSCESYGHDRYGRTLARCMAGTTELNRAMVKNGWALAYGDYDVQEAQARKARRGLWRGDFTPPEEWRRAHDRLDAAPHQPLSAFWDWLRDLGRLWIGNT